MLRNLAALLRSTSTIRRVPTKPPMPRSASIERRRARQRYVNLTRAREARAQRRRSPDSSGSPRINARARLSTASGDFSSPTATHGAPARRSRALSVPGATEEAALGAVRALARIYERRKTPPRSATCSSAWRNRATRSIASLRRSALLRSPPDRSAIRPRDWCVEGTARHAARGRALAALEPLLGDIGDAIGLADVLRPRRGDDRRTTRAPQRAASAHRASGNVGPRRAPGATSSGDSARRARPSRVGFRSSSSAATSSRSMAPSRWTPS